MKSIASEKNSYVEIHFRIYAFPCVLLFTCIIVRIPIQMIYQFGLNYITPVIRIQLSYNRLGRKLRFRNPKDEIDYIHPTIVCLLFSEIFTLTVIPFLIYARMWQPSLIRFVYILAIIAVTISILFMRKVKKAKVYEKLLEEANKLTKEEHKVRRKALLHKSLLYYLLPIICAILSCALF